MMNPRSATNKLCASWREALYNSICVRLVYLSRPAFRALRLLNQLPIPVLTPVNPKNPASMAPRPVAGRTLVGGSIGVGHGSSVSVLSRSSGWMEISLPSLQTSIGGVQSSDAGVGVGPRTASNPRFPQRHRPVLRHDE